MYARKWHSDSGPFPVGSRTEMWQAWQDYLGTMCCPTVLKQQNGYRASMNRPYVIRIGRDSGSTASLIANASVKTFSSELVSFYKSITPLTVCFDHFPVNSASLDLSQIEAHIENILDTIVGFVRSMSQRRRQTGRLRIWSN